MHGDATSAIIIIGTDIIYIQLRQCPGSGFVIVKLTRDHSEVLLGTRSICVFYFVASRFGFCFPHNLFGVHVVS